MPVGNAKARIERASKSLTPVFHVILAQTSREVLQNLLASASKVLAPPRSPSAKALRKTAISRNPGIR